MATPDSQKVDANVIDVSEQLKRDVGEEGETSVSKRQLKRQKRQARYASSFGRS
jgi:hypothetical protein